MVSGSSGTFSWTHHRCLQTSKTSWGRCLRRKRSASGDAGSAADGAPHRDESRATLPCKRVAGLARPAWEGKNVSRASAQEATRAWWTKTATTLPQEGHGSRHPSEAVLLTSDSVHAGRCTRVRAHHAASNPRAPVSPLNRASPISLSCHDRCGFPHTVSLAYGYPVLALWSGQKSS
jgi:hypothetical protein